MDIKRDGQGVVDAISAEDIGKMPDTNLAESLQRVTGVSIDRVNGEGSRVTVRGFGPDFNVITLNGRQMPAANLEDTTAVRGSRSFDFANLAAESVSGCRDLQDRPRRPAHRWYRFGDQHQDHSAHGRAGDAS